MTAKVREMGFLGAAGAASAAAAASAPARAAAPASVPAPPLDLAALEAAAAAVPDPELPVVTIGDLGIVRGVSVTDDGAIEVRLTPTFVGCPATEAIAADVRAAVTAAAPAVEVRTRMVMSPAWTTDWITEDGRRKLAEHGIAPPGAGRGGGPVLVQISSFPSPHPPTQKNQNQACPRCGSTETRELSAFGSTPCQSLRACRACGEPFGAMKSL